MRSSKSDLHLMQRHLLNIEALNSPFKIIAAATVSSEADTTITELDIMRARQIIFGSATTFPGSRLWTFVKSDFIFQTRIIHSPLTKIGPLFDFVQNFSSLLPSSLDPDGWNYTHLPLDEQFSHYGIRQIKLDLYYDPQGGRFYNRYGNQLVSEPVESGIAELNDPGFKVLHVADVDYMTNYYTFKQALQAVKNWSDAHPRHLPIFILIETKETSLAGAIPVGTWTETLHFDLAAMNAIDDEIKDVFGAALEGVLTPDEVRGSFATLNEAVTTRGWPRIGETRGKVVFLLNNSGDVADYYLQGHPSLQGRIMFTNANAGSDDAAFIMENNPFDSRIQQWVSQGYIIRTRADDNTDEARTGETTRRDRAFASGAQLISTDYYPPDPRHLTDPTNWTNYSVRFPNNEVARLNPVNGPAKFTGGPIE